jgi:hypothetical protein
MKTRWSSGGVVCAIDVEGRYQDNPNSVISDTLREDHAEF